MILKFSSQSCQPCKVLAETLNQLGIETTPIDIDESPDLVAKYCVRAVPTLIYIEDGMEYGRLTGNKTAKEIKRWLDGCNYEATC